MLKNLEGARLGIFIFVGTVLLVISIFLLGNKEKLFTGTINIKTYFNQIEGLKPGAPVRLSGYDIGSVSSIALVDEKSGNVEVLMRIDDNLKHFIRLDSEAAIETEGLVGKKIVTISAGSSSIAEIQDGGIIKSKNPLNLSAIMEQTESTISYLKDLTQNLAEVVGKVNRGEGTIGKIVNDDRLYESAVNITRNADKSLTAVTQRLTSVSDIIVEMTGSINSIITSVDTAIVDVRNIIEKVNNGEGTLGALISDEKIADSVKTIMANLTKTSEDARMATSSLAENMEALKHNWLFKGYFEKRGYWNKVEYEDEIDNKLEELKRQNDLLDKKIKELLDLENKIGTLKTD
jgi:phospholipid/cholesterol/gamma-HCH transport system substrate-binding protein